MRLPLGHTLIIASVVMLAMVAGACTTDPAVKKQKYLEAGNQYFDRGQFREAAVEYRNAVQVDERFGAARARLATTYERLGDVGMAAKEYIRAADLLPDDADVQLAAAGYLLVGRRFDDAKKRAENVLKRDPKNVRAQVALGNALAGLRDFDNAIKEMEQAIELDPQRAATYANLGMLEGGRGRVDAAEAAFQRAIVLDPKWIPARLGLANQYWAAGRLAGGGGAPRGRLASEPQNALVNRALALMMIATRRTAAAEPYIKTLAASPSSPFALADYYVVNGRAADAIA